jgi:hypothetical protein
MAALESILSQAGILAPGQLENILGGKGKLTLVSLDHTLPNGSYRTSTSGPVNNADASADIGDGQEGESDTEGAALTLEHLAFGRRKQEQGAGSSHSTHTNAGPGSMLRRNLSEMNGMGPTDMSFEMGDGIRGQPVDPFGRPGASTIAVRDPSEVYPHSMTFSVLPPGTTAAGVPANLLPQVPLRLKENMAGPVRSEVLDALNPMEVFSVFYQRNDVFVKALLSVLPDRSKGELLVRSVSVQESTVTALSSLTLYDTENSTLTEWSGCTDVRVTDHFSRSPAHPISIHQACTYRLSSGNARSSGILRSHGCSLTCTCPS